MSLYRKYRPHNFDNLVGQAHVKTTLVNALKSGHTAHAYLFTGPRGTGKTSTARLIAKALNCESLKNGFEPCDECELCKDINEGRLIDLVEIDAASNRGIDEVRDLKEKINFAPTRSKVKVYIIDEVHMMTKEAFNALLKTLEEPPEHAYFILATTEIHKIPETIISRCQRFDFRRIEAKDLVGRLSHVAKEEKIEAEPKALEIISKYVNGGLRDAIGLLEQLSNGGKLEAVHVQEILGVSDTTLISKLYELLLARDTSEALKVIHELHDHGSDLKQFSHEFVDSLRRKMLDSVSEGKRDETAQLIKMIEVFQDAQHKLEASIPQLSLEIAVIKICGAVGKAEKAEPVKKIEEVKVEKEVKKEVKVEKTPEKIPEKAVAEEPVVEKEVSEKKVDKNIDLTMAQIEEKWPRVIERLKRPSLKMSIKSAHPSGLNELAITVSFGTNFHKNKVEEHDNRVELEKVMEEVFGTPLKLEAEVKPLEIKPVSHEEDKIDFEQPAAEEESEKKSDQAVNEALDIFGGELV